MSDASADDLDRATDLTLAMTESYIKDAALRAKPEQVKVDGQWPQKECDDCGENIPVKRLNLGKIRCIFCQEALERRRAGR